MFSLENLALELRVANSGINGKPSVMMLPNMRPLHTCGHVNFTQEQEFGLLVKILSVPEFEPQLCLPIPSSWEPAADMETWTQG